MRLSIAEGSAYAWMVGLGETYVLADAIRLGASRLEQGLVVTLPLFLGALGPLLCLRLLARRKRRKGLAVGAIAAQAANLMLLAVADFLQRSSPALLIALAAVHQVTGQAVGTAWSSWFGDLVPDAVRGRYFARRNRFVYASIGGGMLAGGFLLQRLEGVPAGIAQGSGGRGFALLFALAALARGTSAVLLALTPEPTFRGVADRSRVRRYLATARGSRAWRVVLLVFAMQLAVYVASPYFTPFVLESLSFSYAELTAANLTVMLAKVAMLPAWGRVIDQLAARSAFALAALLLALVPLPWLWADGPGWALGAYAYSGFAWAGYEVSLFALLLSSSYRHTRPHVFAMHSVLNGAGQLGGSLVGAWIAGAADQSLRLVFAASLAARLAAALAAPWIVPPAAGEADPPRRSLLLRVIGLRPMGGVVHRPLEGETSALDA